MKPIKLAVVGGRRGATFNKILGVLKDRITLSCICDISKERVDEWRKEYPGIRGFSNYHELLEKGDCDAVFIATPVQIHVEQAVAALTAGKHVISEVWAAGTIDDCWKLIETVNRTKLTYMMAENYCFMRPNMMVQNMVDKGLFGRLTYAEGAYIHDCRHLRVNEDGSMTWRGDFLSKNPGNNYPTHSLGPVAKWLDIGKTDRMVRTASFATPSVANYEFVARNFGKKHPELLKVKWKGSDSVTTLIETEKGVLINIRVDSSSPRPHNMVHYHLQGSKASYLSPRHEFEEPLIWLEGLSKTEKNGQAGHTWDTLWKYSCRYEHPLWNKYLEIAQTSGHGGGDFFVLMDFADAVRGKKKPYVDVYDAVEWSCIVPLSEESIRRGGKPVEIPDFRKKRK